METGTGKLKLKKDHFKGHLFSFRSAVVISAVVLAGYLAITFLISENSLRACLTDIVGPIIELLVVLCLFCVAELSRAQVGRVRTFWLIIATALLCYVVGDLIWAILELIFHQQLFSPVVIIFYFLFYLLFVLAVIYLPGKPLSRNKKIKMILDTSLIAVTCSLIFGIFLLPYIGSSYSLNIRVIAYAVGDFIIFLALLRILFHDFKGFYRTPLLFLGGGIIAQIITDNIYSYQVITGIYTAAGLLNTGWLLAILFIYLAAVFEINLLTGNKKFMEFELRLSQFNFPPYLPLLTVLTAYIIVILVNNNQISIRGLYIETAVGIIIVLVVFKQAIMLNENENLYLAAKKEIKNRKKSETYYRTIFENTGTAIAIFDENIKISLVNTEFEKLSGYTKEELTGKNWKDFVINENLETAENSHYLMGLNLEWASKNYEVKIMNKKGKLLDVYANVVMIPSTTNWLASFRDITREKRSRKALLESEEKYRKLFHNMDEMVSLNEVNEKGLPGKFIEVNEVMCNKLSYTTDELLNMSPSDIAVMDNAGDMFKIAEKLHNERHVIFESVNLTKDQKNVSVEVNLHLFKLNGREVVLAVSRDISARKNAEKALKLSNMYNRSLIEASLDPLITIGPDGKITDVNSSTETATGYSRRELVGTNFSNYFTKPEKAQEGYKKVFKNGSVRDYPLEIQNKNGTSIPVLYNATTYKDESGNVIGVLAAARDITKLKQAEKELKSSLNEKELLLKEVHHRVKNNMQIISSLLRLQSNYIHDDLTLQAFKESEERIRAMSLVHESIYLSNNLSSINFENYIKRLVMGIVTNYNARKISLNLNIEDIILNIETAIPCGLIITELVTNSLKYAFLKEEGSISINFTRKLDNMELVVSDDGVGLPEHLLHEKSDSLGLLLVKTLVNQLEGDLKIDNTKGTVFTVIFKELEYAKRV